MDRTRAPDIGRQCSRLAADSSHDFAGNLTVPGAIGAACMTGVAAADDVMAESCAAPVSYFFGSRDVAANPPLFQSLVRDLSANLQAHRPPSCSSDSLLLASHGANGRALDSAFTIHLPRRECLSALPPPG